MSDNNREMHHYILVVSNAESFNSAFRQSLPEGMFVSLEFRKNATEARHQILERYYDIVVINFPLPDENGLELAIDIAEQNRASVMVAAPGEVYENVLDYVTSYGVLAVPKPASNGRIGKALALLFSFQERVYSLEMEIQKAQDQLEELRSVSRAKFLLIEKKHMTEDEAHRYIGKQAMNHGLSKRRMAEEIIEEYQDF